MIRVVIADDHHLVRQGLRALLEKAGDILVVGEASDGSEAVTLVAQLSPDVAVMDIAMPRLNGIQAIERIQALGLSTPIVVLSVYSDATTVRQVLRRGAKGYLLKKSVFEELLLAIRAACRGETYLSPPISELILSGILSQGGQSGDEVLSAREREVLQLVAEGHTNAAIAQLMNISAKTVEKHRANIMVKLNVHDTAGLVRSAIRFGLVEIGS